MNKIKIEPVSVSFNTIANHVSFDVLMMSLPPKSFNLNARFFKVTDDESIEVANVPFELPIDCYNEWDSDYVLENQCLIHLNLKRVN